ncbi:MAG TPA: pyrroline-5-carboxylate reductase [Verrucomicrobiota bacterium]|nr:pyrroline-5-carboxylate reductase [Verrucomicrobiota bacterium]HNU50978.1 pyrroline-5-carboxylate reductase [Verrucomicrobiota bacterium]
MTDSTAPLTLGFIGAGKMAMALASGFLRANLVRPQDIIACDIAEDARKAFASPLGARSTGSMQEAADAATVLILAVKPDQLMPVLDDLSPALNPRHLLVSIAAGIPLGRIEAALPAGTRVIRVMPNAPALVGASMSVYAPGSSATEADAALTDRLLSTLGMAVRLPERLLDAATGLSGSGPAYACIMIEALSDGGVAAGLPRAVAIRLAAQTLLGTARWVLETGQHPAALKDMVASPGGTTIEGLHELERAGLRGALISAVRASAAKARSLGEA